MNSKFDKKSMPIRSSYFTLGIHLLICLSLLFVPILVAHNIPDSTGLSGYYFFFANLYHIALFYLNAYFLYPRLFTRKLWLSYLLITTAIIGLSYYAKLYLLHSFSPFITLNAYSNRIIFFPPIAFLIAGVVYRMVKDRIEFEKLEKERKAERLVSELKFLRSQVNPHFLFNMMTNMVSLARIKSDMLETSLIKLSDLLRYMLYESDKEKMLISDEISYLKTYIELQQMRFGEETNLQLEIKDDHSSCYIEPMLLVPFVENAFKHGIGTVENPFIKISIEIKAEHFSFSISNNYNKGDSSKDKSAGIGLDNVTSRLKLLYPGKYELILDNDGSIYTVKLNIRLSC